MPEKSKKTDRSRTGNKSFFNLTAIIIIVSILSGCSLKVSSFARDFMEDLSHVVRNSNDPETIEAGAPAYLIMIDSLVRGEPDNAVLLSSAATLYSTYSGVFIKDPQRAARLSEKALGYGLRALCVRNHGACSLQQMDFKLFSGIIDEMTVKDVPALFALGAAWAGWIKTHSEDLNAVAQLSRVEVIMARIVELDEFYQDGSAHIYLGVISTLMPSALGGRPDEGRRHFERAIEISEGNNLMAKVSYAQQYARLIFDRDLHDRLLNEVVKSNPEYPGYTLINTIAQQEAHRLLESGEDFF